MKVGRFFIVDNADNLQKYASYFKDGQVEGHLLDRDTDNTIVLYYPNSQTVMAYLKATNTTPQEITYIYFYHNGNAIFKVVKDDKDNISEVLAWDETGKSVKPKKFAKDNETTLANMDETVKEILSSL